MTAKVDAVAKVLMECFDEDTFPYDNALVFIDRLEDVGWIIVPKGATWPTRPIVYWTPPSSPAPPYTITYGSYITTKAAGDA